jgi:hypothetical protein
VLYSHLIVACWFGEGALAVDADGDADGDADAPPAHPVVRPTATTVAVRRMTER